VPAGVSNARAGSAALGVVSRLLSVLRIMYGTANLAQEVPAAGAGVDERRGQAAAATQGVAGPSGSIGPGGFIVPPAAVAGAAFGGRLRQGGPGAAAPGLGGRGDNVGDYTLMLQMWVKHNSRGR
jgi:hypothetical protein